MAALMKTVSVVIDAAGLATGLELPAFLLRCKRGPDRRLERRFARQRVLIGTGEGADLRLSDPTVSAVHCELFADSSGFRVRDLGSRNAVLMGGRRVREAWLRPTDDLVLGESVLRFELLGDSERHNVPRQTQFGRLRGSSFAMRQVYEQLGRAAAVDHPVLLTGETGTGKDLAVEALVQAGPRAQASLVVVDCAALAPQLAEAELFGYAQGAFTGATAERQGAFERAHQGTLCLDHVDELPPELQPKLLGALERGTVRRLGASTDVPVDVRVIACTSRELEREVNLGRFRADLFYRLAVIAIRLPPLAERPEDIPELIAAFLQGLPHAVPLSPATLERLYRASYPGNVRELRNAVERATLQVDEPTARAALPPLDLEFPFRVQKLRLVEAFERRYFRALLEACGGNVSEAARRAGLNRVYLHEVLQRLRLS
jgi:two-component system, NtrC family, response regulator GlrR